AGLREREDAGELGDVEAVVGEHAHQAQPGGVGEQPEDGGGALHVIYESTYRYIYVSNARSAAVRGGQESGPPRTEGASDRRQWRLPRAEWLQIRACYARIGAHVCRSTRTNSPSTAALLQSERAAVHNRPSAVRVRAGPLTPPGERTAARWDPQLFPKP